MILDGDDQAGLFLFPLFFVDLEFEGGDDLDLGFIFAFRVLFAL